MQSLYVYTNPEDHDNGRKTAECLQPIMLDGYYLTGYHDTPIKVGDRVILLFSMDIDCREFRRELVRVMSIRMQYWDMSNKGGDTDLHKFILEETVPSYKNWLKVQFISEEREEKLNELIDDNKSTN
jgi:hypothetical protein